MNREDRRPIIAEVKVGNDMNPFYALIQTLMYAAELATFNQATRLQQHYDQVRFPELANSSGGCSPGYRHLPDSVQLRQNKRDPNPQLLDVTNAYVNASSGNPSSGHTFAESPVSMHT